MFFFKKKKQKKINAQPLENDFVSASAEQSDYSVFNTEQSELKVQLIECDCAVEDMKEQLPVTCQLLRMIPGADRPDYWLAKCEKPMSFNGKTINYLIVGTRFCGQAIKKDIGTVTLNVAYVLNETLINDARLDFSKAQPAAICVAKVI